MALIKIIYNQKEAEQVNDIAKAIKFICSAGLNCPEVFTTPSQIETVKIAGIDLIGINYILEIVACERPNLQKISDNIINGLNAVYPDKLFSVYFNIINEQGMSSTPRERPSDKSISMDEAIQLSKNNI